MPGKSKCDSRRLRKRVSRSASLRLEPVRPIAASLRLSMNFCASAAEAPAWAKLGSDTRAATAARNKRRSMCITRHLLKVHGGYRNSRGRDVQNETSRAEAHREAGEFP